MINPVFLLLAACLVIGAVWVHRRASAPRRRLQTLWRHLDDCLDSATASHVLFIALPTDGDISLEATPSLSAHQHLALMEALEKGLSRLPRHERQAISHLRLDAGANADAFRNPMHVIRRDGCHLIVTRTSLVRLPTRGAYKP